MGTHPEQGTGMKTSDALRLLHAIDGGKIRSQRDAHRLNIHPATLWRWVADLREMGVVIETGAKLGRPPRGQKYHQTPWRVVRWGMFRRKA